MIRYDKIGRRIRHITSPEERFLEKVYKNGPVPAHRPELGPCWVWTGGKTSDGYGNFGIGKKKIRAHRFLRRDIPGHLNACHHCDNTLCVRPDHIFPGTQKENIQDGISKGRIRNGAHGKYANTRLNWEIVAMIRGGVRKIGFIKEMAEKLHVCRRTVQDVIHNATWKEEWRPVRPFSFPPAPTSCHIPMLSP